MFDEVIGLYNKYSEKVPTITSAFTIINRHLNIVPLCFGPLHGPAGEGLAYNKDKALKGHSRNIEHHDKYHQTWLACLVTSDDSSGGITKLEHVPRNNTLGPVPDAAC